MDDFTPRENINHDYSPGYNSQPHKKLKEKNLYILHLDSPRIIIISCVMIGLLVVSLLIGMNISKFSEKDRDIFAENNGMIDNLLSGGGNTGINPVNSGLIDPVPDDKDEFSAAIPPLGELAKNNTNASSPVENILNNNSTGKTDPVGAVNTDDILTHENIESIIPPSNLKPKLAERTVKKSVKKKPAASKETAIKKKKDVVEVASIRKNPDTEKEISGDYFSVQVASYDSNSKATEEAKKLKDRRYDSFVDTAVVDGKKFYRVRIGPVYSMKKACNLLDEITEDERYKDSYIVKK